jgi:predicted DNA-binding transcriptional regulator AlpA
MNLSAQQVADRLLVSRRYLIATVRNQAGFPKPLPHRKRGLVWAEEAIINWERDL